MNGLGVRRFEVLAFPLRIKDNSSMARGVAKLMTKGEEKR